MRPVNQERKSPKSRGKTGRTPSRGITRGTAPLPYGRRTKSSSALFSRIFRFCRGLLDIRRLSDMLSRIQGRIIHRELGRVSPLAVPVMLEIGREAVYGEASDELLAEAAEELVKEAMDRT